MVLASAGYPAVGPTGVPIPGIERRRALRGVHVFHAGDGAADRRIVTAGGRVLTVVGRGATFEEAIERAYEGVSAISFDGMQYRRDIGRKAAASQTAEPRQALMCGLIDSSFEQLGPATMILHGLYMMSEFLSDPDGFRFRRAGDAGGGRRAGSSGFRAR